MKIIYQYQQNKNEEKLNFENILSSAQTYNSKLNYDKIYEYFKNARSNDKNKILEIYNFSLRKQNFAEVSLERLQDQIYYHYHKKDKCDEYFYYKQILEDTFLFIDKILETNQNNQFVIINSQLSGSIYQKYKNLNLNKTDFTNLIRNIKNSIQNTCKINSYIKNIQEAFKHLKELYQNNEQDSEQYQEQLKIMKNNIKEVFKERQNYQSSKRSIITNKENEMYSFFDQLESENYNINDDPLFEEKSLIKDDKDMWSYISQKITTTEDKPDEQSKQQQTDQQQSNQYQSYEQQIDGQEFYEEYSDKKQINDKQVVILNAGNEISVLLSQLDNVDLSAINQL